MTAPARGQVPAAAPAPPGRVPGKAELAGALMFVRYAFAPNALGYCGPADSAALRQYGEAGVVDHGLVQLAQAFTGAWPYLELVAGAHGIADPLDRRVVEAYWVGNALLDAVPLARLADSLEDRFRRLVGTDFGAIAEGALGGGVPHHSFHVFAVYPWVGMLGDGRRSERALTVLDRCRIRWGQVITAGQEHAVVLSRPLRWDGRYLSLGEPVSETVRSSVDGTGLPLTEGDWVSLHWDWVCDRLTYRQLRALRGYTLRHLELVNHRTGKALRLP